MITLRNKGFNKRMKTCKRCNVVFWTTGKYDKICSACKRPAGGKRVDLLK